MRYLGLFKHFYLLFIYRKMGLFLSMAFAVHAFAFASDCYLENIRDVYITLSPTPILFSENTAIGSVVATFTMESSPKVANVSCGGPPGSGVIELITTTMTQVQGQQGVYATNISGLGIKFLFRDGLLLPYKFSPAPATWGGEFFTVQFIKIGPISSGSYTLNGLSKAFGWKLANLWASGTPLYWAYRGTTVRVIPHTCSVAQSVINIPLGTMNKTVFTNIGSTSPDIPFNLQLNCSGGVGTSSVTKVYTTFTDSINPGNTSVNLSLSKDSSASGLAVQFVNKKTNKLVSFGPDSNSLGNTNQIYLGDLVGTDGNGLMTYPFSAHYIRTGTVVGGSANSSATFTMSYN